MRSIDRQIATLRRSGNGDATRNEIETLIASRRRIVAGLDQKGQKESTLAPFEPSHNSQICIERFFGCDFFNKCKTCI